MAIDGSMVRAAGPNVVLRLITPDDAEYVHAVRTNPVYNQFLSAVNGTAQDQRLWIERYKTREAAGDEFYYVIERHDGVRCGVVRLYDLTDESFAWGSWILDHNKPRKAALESALLSFELGFEALDRPRALVDVRVENSHAHAFYQRLGMTELRRTAQDIFLSYARDRFRADRAQYRTLLGFPSVLAR